MKKKKKKQKKKNPGQYDVYAFRLHGGTVEKMRESRGDLSWNRYFYKKCVENK